MKKIAIIMMLITIISKIMGFVRDITLSFFYGASYVSDAYLISSTIPNSIFGFIGAGIATGYIPMLTKLLYKKGFSESERFTNNLINLILLISTSLFIISFLFTEEIVKLFASGFEGETLKLAINFTRISLLGIYFTGLINIFSGYLQVKGSYATTALVALPMNLILILFIFISYYNDVIFLAIGTVISLFIQFIFLLPAAFRKGYRYKLIINIKDKYIREIIYVAIPVIIGVSVNEINVLVDRTIASNIIEGGISALSYSQRITGVIQGIFVMSIVTVMFPIISKFAAEHKIKMLKETLTESINIVSLLVIPATIYIMFLSKPIVEVLFGRGAFDQQAVELTSVSLFFYAIGMIGFGLRQVISKVFYSLEDTKTPMINASISLLINIILNIILSTYLGIGGLAFATSISANLATILLLISLRRKIGQLGLKRLVFSNIKMLISSLIMGFTAKITYGFFLGIFPQVISISLSIIIGLILYLIIIYFMKVKEAEMLFNIFKGRLLKTSK